jgi:RNA recognition motif-containing protein
MRENVGREGAEDGWKRVEGIKPQRRKGFVHRREKDILSYFFTNFSGEVTVMDLWEEFGRFGRVGEVYILKKLDKQGRRFGFVKFRVRDAGELLARLEDIWLGSFKLRVNISRFAKGDIRREKEEPVLEGNSTVVRRPEVGKSFKEAVVVVADKNVTQPGLVQGVRDVAWEVEV